MDLVSVVLKGQRAMHSQALDGGSVVVTSNSGNKTEFPLVSFLRVKCPFISEVLHYKLRKIGFPV